MTEINGWARFPVVLSTGGVTIGAIRWNHRHEGQGYVDVNYRLGRDVGYVRVYCPRVDDPTFIRNLKLSFGNIADTLKRWLPRTLTFVYDERIANLDGTSYSFALMMGLFSTPDILYTGVGFHERDGSVIAESAEKVNKKMTAVTNAGYVIMVANSPEIARTRSYMFADWLANRPLVNQNVFEVNDMAEALFLAMVMP